MPRLTTDQATAKLYGMARHLEAAGRSIAMRVNEVAGRKNIRDKRDREEVSALMVIMQPLELAQDEWNAIAQWFEDEK